MCNVVAYQTSHLEEIHTVSLISNKLKAADKFLFCAPDAILYI
jgi:hypothetical protein